MEVALELLRRLAQNDQMMWVVGGAGVVSENNSKGIKEPEVSGGNVTMERKFLRQQFKKDDPQ